LFTTSAASDVRILLVERDADARDATKTTLRAERFKVFTADDGYAALDFAKLYDYDLILMDATPQLTVCDMLRSLRLARCKTPILVLSVEWRPDRIVQALSAGADDYMAKPFHAEELVARIRAVVRRSRGHAASLVTVGQLAVNMDSHHVTLAGAPLRLTRKEYAVLTLLALHRNSLVTKDMFLNHMYGGRDEPHGKIIDVFICKLRKQLGEHAKLISTVHSCGYVLRDPEAGATVPSLALEMHAICVNPGAFSPDVKIRKYYDDVDDARQIVAELT
jgi:two-component system cell cycle response regulator CtrA